MTSKELKDLKEKQVGAVLYIITITAVLLQYYGGTLSVLGMIWLWTINICGLAGIVLIDQMPKESVISVVTNAFKWYKIVYMVSIVGLLLFSGSYITPLVYLVVNIALYVFCVKRLEVTK